jgi:hypothetical protein
LPLVPFATFLAGALLTILLPLALLIALVVWYYMFSVRVPETERGPETRTDPAAANPGPDIPETLPPEPGAQ